MAKNVPLSVLSQPEVSRKWEREDFAHKSWVDPMYYLFLRHPKCVKVERGNWWNCRRACSIRILSSSRSWCAASLINCVSLRRRPLNTGGWTQLIQAHAATTMQQAEEGSRRQSQRDPKRSYHRLSWGGFLQPPLLDLKQGFQKVILVWFKDRAKYLTQNQQFIVWK